MASGSLQCKRLVLRVSIHCEGCKKKVKKALQSVEGVCSCDIDGRSNKATVAVTAKVSAGALIKKLRRAGKQAELWPEEQKQPDQPAGIQAQESKDQTTEPDNSGEPAGKPVSGNAGENAAVPSYSKASPEEPEKCSGDGDGDGEGDAAKPDQESTESAGGSIDGAKADGGVGHGGPKEATAEQSVEPEKKWKQPEEEKPVGATAAAMPAQASYLSHSPPLLHQQQPVQVVSYNVARPTASAACCYPAARLPPQLERSYLYSYPYSPYYHCSPPSTHSYYYQCYDHATPATRSAAASPARNSYCDLFSDDNANSCSVM